MHRRSTAVPLWLCIACLGSGCSTRIQSTGNPTGGEICDGRDNDDDSKIDEDDPRNGEPCGGASMDAGLDTCEQQVWRCHFGKGMACVIENTATTEICNDKDDDCDSQIDENFVCDFPSWDAG